MESKEKHNLNIMNTNETCVCIYMYVQGDSLARGPKLLSIKNYVIEMISSEFIYTYRQRC
jgi:hypothetical protein